MRKRFNRGAICSSENYVASKKAHQSFLKERHEHFSLLAISGEPASSMPTVTNSMFQPRTRTIKVFGKEITISAEEYNTIYAKCNF